MKVVDLYARVRRACHVDGVSQRQAARLFGIDPKTVAKMLRFSVPPGYRRSKPVTRPKLDLLVPVIERILEEDRSRPRKQRHTDCINQRFSLGCNNPPRNAVRTSRSLASSRVSHSQTTSTW